MRPGRLLRTRPSILRLLFDPVVAEHEVDRYTNARAARATWYRCLGLRSRRRRPPLATSSLQVLWHVLGTRHVCHAPSAMPARQQPVRLFTYDRTASLAERERVTYEMQERAGSEVSRAEEEGGRMVREGERALGTPASHGPRRPGVNRGRTSFQIPSGGTVFEIPSAPWVPKQWRT